ncbi:hypothetical protein D030_2290A, partial [Vibrio parahaemolyticus AQ3810]
MGEARNELT